MSHVQATTKVLTSFAFECSGCGYVGRARVSGEGYAEAESDEHGAAERAEGAAWNDALTTVELAPCPRCGVRDRSRWAAWLRAQVVPSVTWGAVGALVAGAATFLLRQRMDFTPMAAGLASWIAIATGAMTQRVLRKTSRASTLGFDPRR